jgi:DNA-binding NtrC family response regulator
MGTTLGVALVVEDEAIISLDLEDALGRAGFQVIVQDRREAAETWLRDNSAAFAVIDVELPDGTCHNLADQLASAGVPFVVYSGGQHADYVDTAFAGGHWVSKPGSTDKIIELAMKLAGMQPDDIDV